MNDGDLSFVSTDDLVKELCKRHDNIVMLRINPVDGKPLDQSFEIVNKVQDNEFHAMVGMLEFCKYTIMGGASNAIREFDPEK